jgi:hypothetical protein
LMDNSSDISLAVKALRMGGGEGRGRWVGGIGVVCCVVWHELMPHMRHEYVMNVHHSTDIPEKLQILTNCTFVYQITGASFGQSAYFNFATFGCVFQCCYFWVHFSKLSLHSTSKSYMACTTQLALLSITK